jgi:hypothetical protein
VLASAASPDGNIHVRIGRPEDIEVTFSRGAYRRYDEGTLARQLGRLAALGWVAYDRARTEEHRRALGRGTEEFAEDMRYPKDERRQRYDADLAAVEAQGGSPSGLVRVRAKGMLQWRVAIEPGALRRLAEDGFLRELNAAVHALFTDREVQITVIKSRYYDLGIPRKWRELLNDLAGSR